MKHAVPFLIGIATMLAALSLVCLLFGVDPIQLLEGMP